MAFSRYNKDRPFLLINRFSSLSEGQKSSIKDFGKSAKWKTDEEVVIVDRVTDKHMLQATVIIDILRQKMIKNRFSSQTDSNTVMKHYMNEYNDYIVDGIKTWMKQKTSDPEIAEKTIQDFQEELEKINVEIVSDKENNSN